MHLTTPCRYFVCHFCTFKVQWMYNYTILRLQQEIVCWKWLQSTIYKTGNNQNLQYVLWYNQSKQICMCDCCHSAKRLQGTWLTGDSAYSYVCWLSWMAAQPLWRMLFLTCPSISPPSWRSDKRLEPCVLEPTLLDTRVVFEELEFIRHLAADLGLEESTSAEVLWPETKAQLSDSLICTYTNLTLNSEHDCVCILNSPEWLKSDMIEVHSH